VNETTEDLVGSRVLAGVQMVNISRLSTHPVPITARGLITVAGQGPTDSNGAGKSSFIAGLSLLHADDQWRLQSGAQAAAELLFTAELAGQEAAHANADRGYLIGVFVPPGADTEQELDAQVLTVWLRINRQSPHVELRWAHRLHLPYGDTENERAGGADALWDALPRSNGRSDLRANRLAKTLYGGAVRCVSFLSTSVRASPTANLLAQPLNELSPERIFDALGALTGLTQELDQEQKARAEEYEHAAEAERAAGEYTEWDRRMIVLEAGIRSRQQARDLLEETRVAWRGRCARTLVDGVAEAEGIAIDLAGHQTLQEELAAATEQEQHELGRLTDDTAFRKSVDARIAAYTRLRQEMEQLQRAHSETVGQVESLTERQQALRGQALAADGLGADEAAAARAAAEQQLETTQQGKGITASVRRAAQRALEAAERGQDVAAAQIDALREHGITAAPLVDVVVLDEAQRPVWEARLLPYRSAVVVPRAEAGAAAAVLAALPGSVLVRADPDGLPPASDPGLPRCFDDTFGLTTFLTALAGRAGDGGIDDAAGVSAVAGFAEPMTGRAGRISTARAALTTAISADEDADAAITAAARKTDAARVRERAAAADLEAAAVGAQIAKLRANNLAVESAQAALAEPMAVAAEDYQQALGDRAAREGQIRTARARIAALDKEREQAQQRRETLLEQRAVLDLPARQQAWDAPVEAAEKHLAGLGEQEQNRPAPEWDDLVERLADRTQAACFPPGTPDEQIPEELRLIDEQRRERRSAARIRLVPAVLRLVGDFLDQHARVDRQTAGQIETERTEKTATLRGAQAALEEARKASAALRATIATAIKAKLKLVAHEFNEIDQKYGGYGGSLDYPEPEPPADPQKPWRWSVTPKWRRGEGKPPSSYRLRGNTAQMDDKAVKLVCAAALAGSGDRPLLLILDELGRNLGAAHRRDAVALFENIGRDRAISVVGALQDDMERYAIGASSLYIKLRRPSDTMPYNQAPVVLGSESNAARVRLLSTWMTSYRPAAALY
jgi:hypothetical protein